MIEASQCKLCTETWQHRACREEIKLQALSALLLKSVSKYSSSSKPFWSVLKLRRRPSRVSNGESTFSNPQSEFNLTWLRSRETSTTNHEEKRLTCWTTSCWSWIFRQSVKRTSIKNSGSMGSMIVKWDFYLESLLRLKKKLSSSLTWSLTHLRLLSKT